jgi:hypothetical protein
MCQPSTGSSFQIVFRGGRWGAMVRRPISVRQPQACVALDGLKVKTAAVGLYRPAAGMAGHRAKRAKTLSIPSVAAIHRPRHDTLLSFRIQQRLVCRRRCWSWHQVTS